jgi:hypothetical protein
MILSISVLNIALTIGERNGKNGTNNCLVASKCKFYALGKILKCIYLLSNYDTSIPN